MSKNFELIDAIVSEFGTDQKAGFKPLGEKGNTRSFTLEIAPEDLSAEAFAKAAEHGVRHKGKVTKQGEGERNRSAVLTGAAARSVFLASMGDIEATKAIVAKLRADKAKAEAEAELQRVKAEAEAAKAEAERLSALVKAKAEAEAAKAEAEKALLALRATEKPADMNVDTTDASKPSEPVNRTNGKPAKPVKA